MSMISSSHVEATIMSIDSSTVSLFGFSLEIQPDDSVTTAGEDNNISIEGRYENVVRNQCAYSRSGIGAVIRWTEPEIQCSRIYRYHHSLPDGHHRSASLEVDRHGHNQYIGQWFWGRHPPAGLPSLLRPPLTARHRRSLVLLLLVQFSHDDIPSLTTGRVRDLVPTYNLIVRCPCYLEKCG